MMTAKEQQREAALYLSRYQVAKNEVKDIERRIERVRNEMMGVKGINYENGDIPKAQFRTGDLSDYVARIDDLIQDWKAAQTRALEVMREVSTAIGSVDHDQARRVLMLHFVDGATFHEISRIIKKEEMTVYRLRRIGLSEISKKMKNVIEC